MKRVHSACICQTLHFQLKDGVSSEANIKAVQDEVRFYKLSLEKNRTQYKIEEERTEKDGSVILKIRKQYNNSPIGNYLD